METELALQQLLVHGGRAGDRLSVRPGGAERRSKLPEAAEQCRTEWVPVDPELELAPGF